MSHVSRPIAVVSGVLVALALAGWGVQAAMHRGTEQTRRTSSSVAAPAQATGVGGGSAATGAAVKPPAPADTGSGAVAGTGASGTGAYGSGTGGSGTGSGAAGRAGSSGTHSTGAATLTASTLPGVGSVVTDGGGNVLYRYDRDAAHGKSSACTGPCRAMWSPVLSNGSHPRVRGIDITLVATIRLSDGTFQLTISGFPVYRYNGDHRAGARNGQGKGGLWWLIEPDGHKNVVGAMPTPTPSDSAPADNGGGDPHHW